MGQRLIFAAATRCADPVGSGHKEDMRLYLNAEDFRKADRARADTPCEMHGLPLADCEACTRYDGECDLGGCTRTASFYGVSRFPDGRVAQQRPICAQDRDFAESLGLEIVPMS